MNVEQFKQAALVSGMGGLNVLADQMLAMIAKTYYRHECDVNGNEFVSREYIFQGDESNYGLVAVFYSSKKLAVRHTVSVEVKNLQDDGDKVVDVTLINYRTAVLHYLRHLGYDDGDGWRCRMEKNLIVMDIPHNLPGFMPQMW